MWTAADGDSRFRGPSCGRRYAEAPTAVPFIARGGGEWEAGLFVAVPVSILVAVVMVTVTLGWFG